MINICPNLQQQKCLLQKRKTFFNKNEGIPTRNNLLIYF